MKTTESQTVSAAKLGWLTLLTDYPKTPGTRLVYVSKMDMEAVQELQRWDDMSLVHVYLRGREAPLKGWTNTALLQ